MWTVGREGGSEAAIFVCVAEVDLQGGGFFVFLCASLRLLEYVQRYSGQVFGFRFGQ